MAQSIVRVLATCVKIMPSHRSGALIALAPVIAVLSALMATTASAQWADLWKTPQQQAQEAFRNDNHEYLIDHAPDKDWQGAGEFSAGEFDQAAKTYAERSRENDLQGNAAQATQSLYNQGVSEVMSGEYQKALESFDQVLEREPDFADAEHNRSIVQQLIELQQQPQDSSSSDQGNEQGEQSDESEKSDQGEQSEQGDAGDPSDSDSDQKSDNQGSDEQDAGDQNEQSASSQNNSDQQSDSQSSSAQDQEPSTADSSSTDEQRQQDAQNAQEALAAEAQAQQANDDGESESAQAVSVEAAEQALSESEQAAEQWLRRIPDDPAGLLRRKLEQSHRSEFPEVGDASEPW